MDPNTARAEAERWLGIAAKLLTGRDLVGSRTFAIRAREADPTNPIADQILAVVETLVASEKRVISSTHYDWYSILGLAHLVRDTEVIAAQYRRLVLLLNPDRNGLPYADFALRLVVDAWSVLSDPTKKWLYDSELSLFLQRNTAPAASAAFSVEQHPEPVRVDSAATFQFFQQPLQVEPQTQPQPQPQQWLYPHQPQQQQLQERQLLQQHHSPQPQTQRVTQTHPQPQTHPAAQALPQQQQPVPGHIEQQISPQPQKKKQTESRLVKQQQQQQRQAASKQPPQQQVGERGRGKEVNGRASNVGDERGTHNARKEDSNVNSSDKNKNDKSNDGGEDNDGGIEGFWTACPYCYYMYEYAKTFQDCTLLCQNCRRGFHALQIPNPPPITRHGKETSFCCWGFFPLGFSMTSWKRNNPVGGNDAGFGNSWVPFSPIFACPGQGVKKNVVRQPIVYLDDDGEEDFDDPGSGDDSDSSYDGDNTRKNKKRKSVKGGRGRVVRKSNAEKEREKMKNQNLDGAAGGADRKNPQGLAEMQGNVSHGVTGVKNDVTNKAGGSGSSRKQMGKGVRGRKKLDLNVEFSNEVEEQAPTGTGNGEEEVGFFEGLDEFLSTLPILHVVGDDKAKPS